MIKHDKKNCFLFAPLQGETGAQVVSKFGIDTSKTDSILLLSDDKLYTKSTAALKIASKLGFPRSSLGVLLIIPAFLRNWTYDYIAKNRYKWYGKQEQCMVPTPELKAKFLP